MEGMVVYIDGPKKGEAIGYAEVPSVVHQPVLDEFGVYSLYEYGIDVDNPVGDGWDEAGVLPLFEATQRSMEILDWYNRRGTWGVRTFGPGPYTLDDILQKAQEPLDRKALDCFMEDLKHLMETYGAYFHDDTHSDNGVSIVIGWASEELP